jgi:hypothetical protein
VQVIKNVWNTLTEYAFEIILAAVICIYGVFTGVLGRIPNMPRNGIETVMQTLSFRTLGFFMFASGLTVVIGLMSKNVYTEKTGCLFSALSVYYYAVMVALYIGPELVQTIMQVMLGSSFILRWYFLHKKQDLFNMKGT